MPWQKLTELWYFEPVGVEKENTDKMTNIIVLLTLISMTEL